MVKLKKLVIFLKKHWNQEAIELWKLSLIIFLNNFGESHLI